MSQAEVRGKQERAARNQSLFREVNERVEDVNDRFRIFTPLNDWVCECADDGCAERIVMTCEEYEHIRGNGTRFFVAPGNEHVWPEVERIVERQGHYWIVEKIAHAAEAANDSDPRDGGSQPARTSRS